MKRVRSFIPSLSLAAALAAFALPASALAEETARKPVVVRTGKVKPRGAHERELPMKADAFRDLVERRIAHARERLGEALSKHGVPRPVRAEIEKEFDAGAALVRAAAERAGADGTVTKEEAKEVRKLAKDLKRKAKAKVKGKLGRGDGERRPRRDANERP